MSIEAPHGTERDLNEEYSIIFTQYFLLDAAEIRKVGEPRIGHYLRSPTTPGEWGQWEVGGERMHCHEVGRYNGDHEVDFCREPLADIAQGPLCRHEPDRVSLGRRYQCWIDDEKTDSRYVEWRPVDFCSLQSHKDMLLDWISAYRGVPRLGPARSFFFDLSLIHI